MPQKLDADTKMDAWNSLLYTLGGPPIAESLSTDEGSVRESERALAPIPATVLSGFLGAGKTTLLCKLLAETRLNILAIVNDLAAVNIDAALVSSSTAETMQLENGCACCVLGNDLDEMLSEIGSRREQPDVIVIEASGVSDPMGIAQTIGNNSATTLDGVLTLVDANTFELQRVDPIAATLMQRQLEAAHLILVSKAEDQATVSAMQRAVGELAPGRAVLCADSLTGCLEELVLGARIRGARPEPVIEAHSYQRFANRLVEFGEALPAEAFFAFMEQIPDSIYRIKGWVTLVGATETTRWEFQAVGPRWRVEASADIDQADQLVVIGHKDNELFEGFCTALAML